MMNLNEFLNGNFLQCRGTRKRKYKLDLKQEINVIKRIKTTQIIIRKTTTLAFLDLEC